MTVECFLTSICGMFCVIVLCMTDVRVDVSIVSVDDVWSRCSFVISFGIELLIAVLPALWYSSIFFFGLSCASG